MRITTKTLHETKRLLGVRDSLRIDVDNETVLALAERACSEGKKPAALFQWMLSHPESWEWLSDDDRARARKRLERYGPPARTPIAKRTYADWLDAHLGRPHRIFEPPKASTGWQAESAMIARAHDERLRRQMNRERWGRVLNLVVVAGVLLWLFF